MEQTSDQRMAWLVGQFTVRGIAKESSRECFAQARQNMARRTGSGLVEAVILVGAYLIAYVWIQGGAGRVEGGTWFGQVQDDDLRLTLAGWWLLLVALPLFWFLLGRWLWRFATWGLLLRDIARCDLRLVATHPDRCGGLSFIGGYPNTYVLFVFSLSTVVAAAVLKQVVFGGASLMSFKFALFSLVVFLVVAFVLPLLAFTPVLKVTKEAGPEPIRRPGEPAQPGIRGTVDPQRQPGRAGRGCAWFARHFVAGRPGGWLRAGRADPIRARDQVERVPLILAALLPLVVVAATQAPFRQILGALKGLMP